MNLQVSRPPIVRQILCGYSSITIVPEDIGKRIGGLTYFQESGAFWDIAHLTHGGFWLQATERFENFTGAPSGGRPRTRSPQLGLHPGQARSAALFALATDLPAAPLARMLGIHISVAVAWQCGSAGDWTSYAAELSRRQPANAILTVIATRERNRPDPPYLIPLTINEIRHLFTKLITNTVHTVDHLLVWSRWRRRHQARAKTSQDQPLPTPRPLHPSTHVYITIPGWSIRLLGSC